MSEFTLRVDRGPNAVRTARQRLSRWLRDGRCGDDCSDIVELITSELLTNAVMHGRPPTDLRALVGADRVRLEVSDRTSAPPELHEPLGASGGFGLHIVQELSIDWGWHPLAGGKVVWADVAR